MRDQIPADACAAGDEPGVADWPMGFVRGSALPLQAFAVGSLP